MQNKCRHKNSNKFKAGKYMFIQYYESRNYTKKNKVPNLSLGKPLKSAGVQQWNEFI